MSVIARFEVIPVREGSMSTAIASALRALDRHPVSYRTTATDTIIEAESLDQIFAAVQAAHEAIPEDRVITSVKVDEDRRRPQHIDERVASVEHELGHPPQSGQPAGQQPQRGQQQTGQTAQQGRHQQVQNPARGQQRAPTRQPQSSSHQQTGGRQQPGSPPSQPRH